MEKKTVFTGAATALITPLTEDGIDYAAFERLINWQIEEGINALVVAGTTGEASTLSDDEHRDAIAFAAKIAAGRVPVIAGTGSNDTAYAIDLTKYACEAGADAMLVVSPYYNKATQKGLVKMFTEIADKSTAPVILYNVPSRTGVNIEPDTYRILADHENIVGIKEANGNLSKIVETMHYVHEKLDLYSGNDDQIVPLMALGGVGAISVLSNIMPRETVEICNKFFAAREGVSTEDRQRIMRFIENLCLGAAAVGYRTESMHGAGSPQAQRIMIARQGNIQGKKELAKVLAGIKI